MVVMGYNVLCPGEPSRRSRGWTLGEVFMNVIASVGHWDRVP